MRKDTITTLKRSQLMKYTLLKTDLLATFILGRPGLECCRFQCYL
jgi:hypothetical protein